MGHETKAWTGNASRGFALTTGVLASSVLIALIVGTWVYSVGFGTGAIVGLCLLGVAAIWLPWFQWMDAGRRKHILSTDSVVFCRGIWCRYEIEIPYRHVHAVAVQQTLIQKLFGCGDVRLTTHGVVPTAGLVSTSDMNSLVLRSIPNHVAVGEVVRERMRAAATGSVPS